ncbi:MAG TPA: transposase [Candidatus Limnocylindria bacterium]|nr:transposase [Candidatus Limnocylindria bacterium]
MVFGKKKQPPTGTVVPVLSEPPKQARTKASYRRSTPPATAITAEVSVLLPQACACGGSFDQDAITSHDRYVEDIPLPELTPGYQAKLVTRYVVQRGICLACGKTTSGQDLGGAQVALGPNVRLLVAHLIAVAGMSYAQAAHLILTLYGLVITDGEIANILQKQHRNWLPAYGQLRADIRAAPVRRYDETPWAIQDQGNAGYAWVMSAANSPNTLFHCATSRGAPHAKRLHGKDSSAVHISDDYQAYRTLQGNQQLCWVHLYRAIRDLRYNANLPKEQLAYVTQWYEQFAAIYQDLRLYLDEPFELVVRETQAQELWQRVRLLAQEQRPRAGEPDKLRKLKAQLLRAGKDRLLVCLSKDTPCDNNRAERDLRQLVLKRKRSFGSKTQRGAQALATVLSLCTTTWRSNPKI